MLGHGQRGEDSNSRNSQRSSKCPSVEYTNFTLLQRSLVVEHPFQWPYSVGTTLHGFKLNIRDKRDQGFE